MIIPLSFRQKTHPASFPAYFRIYNPDHIVAFGKSDQSVRCFPLRGIEGIFSINDGRTINAPLFHKLLFKNKINGGYKQDETNKMVPF